MVPWENRMQYRKTKKSLAQSVDERPFPEFARWWKMGNEFIKFMSRAIVFEWIALDESKKCKNEVQSYLVEYLQLVYSQNADPDLVDKFIQPDLSRDFYSGEFDALSYAFYRSSFETLSEKYFEEETILAKERKRFANRVGKQFFKSIHEHLRLCLPSALSTPTHFVQLQSNIGQIGEFLLKQGYLRDKFEFVFTVDLVHAGNRIRQNSDDFLHNLQHNGVGYALYIMGYPAILPSAVYLYKMFGEAQHHSSRTIEELFEGVGFKARETDDFDPSDFPSDEVVELWSIVRRAET